MTELSKQTKIKILISICLWIIGSILLFHENNGKTIIITAGVLLIASIKAQINKNNKAIVEQHES